MWASLSWEHARRYTGERIDTISPVMTSNVRLLERKMPNSSKVCIPDHQSAMATCGIDEDRAQSTCGMASDMNTMNSSCERNHNHAYES